MRVSANPGFFGEKAQSTSTYATYLVVDMGTDLVAPGSVIARCTQVADADNIVAAMNASLIP